MQPFAKQGVDLLRSRQLLGAVLLLVLGGLACGWHNLDQLQLLGTLLQTSSVRRSSQPFLGFSC